MEASIGATCISRTWTRPKAGNTADQNEDACRVVAYLTADGADGLFIAVSDGATEAIYSRQWAQALVAAAEPHWPLLTDREIDARLAGLRASFSPFPPGKEIPWFARDKFRLQGSQATLLVVAIEPEPAGAGSAATIEAQSRRDQESTGTGEEPGGAGFTVRAAAVGDSGLFLFRSDGTVDAFPATKSEDVGVSPALVTSLPRPVGPVARWEGRMQPGDMLALATDAVEKWLLELVEQEQTPRFLEMLGTLWAYDETITAEVARSLPESANVEDAPDPSQAGTVDAIASPGKLLPQETNSSPATNNFATPGGARAGQNAAVSARPQRTGLIWLLERMHILPADEAEPAAAPVATAPASPVDPVQSTAATAAPADPAEPQADEAAAVPPDETAAVAPDETGTVPTERQDALDTFLAEYRSADSTPRMRNDDIALILCVPVQGADARGEVRQVIETHAKMARERPPKVRAQTEV